MNIPGILLSAKSKRFSPWRYGLKLGLAAALLVWWWLQNQRDGKNVVSDKRVILPPYKEKATRVPSAKPKLPPSEPDDLAQIDGIGPKYAAVLMDAGVKSFAQLAQMKPEEVQEIIRAATGRAPDPANWIEQAASLRR